jgi:hypothetical protein
MMRREPNSPTSQAVRQLVKSRQLAMQSATMLAGELAKQRASNHRQRRKRQQVGQYIATGGVLPGQEGDDCVRGADNAVVDQDQHTPLRHVQEHH